MKATLEFTLPEDHAEYTAAFRAAEIADALNTAANDLRTLLKYGNLADDIQRQLQPIYETLCSAKIE